MAERKRTIKVDKVTAKRLSAETKEAKMDEAAELPIPDDGIDHSAWPAEARKLALLHVDPRFLGSTQEQRAMECGYSLRSVQRYESDPKFSEYVNSIARQAFGRLYPIWVAAMEQGLRAGNTKVMELYAKAMGMLKDVKVLSGDINVNDKRESTSGVEDEELRRLRRELGMDDDGGGKVVN